MSDLGFNDVIGLKILKTLGNKKDGTIEDATQNKDTLMSRTYKISKAIDDLSGLSGESNLSLIISFLFSDDDDKVEWAFQQYDIGKALNSMGDFNSDVLSGCHTVDEIANNDELITLIGTNEKAVSACAKNSTLRVKLVSYLNDEDAFFYGYGHSRFNVGDLVTLKYYGADRQFRVVTKDHFTTGKIVLVPEYIEDTRAWNDLTNNNYSSSTIREFLNSYVLSGFSEKIKASITTPAIPCHNNATATTCRDKIWLLSTVEVGFGSGVQYAPDEGKKMSWFTSNARRIKKINNANGAATYWWLRTPYTNRSNDAWYVLTRGESNYYDVTAEDGVAFALEI